jgi:hypothetical protein
MRAPLHRLGCFCALASAGVLAPFAAAQGGSGTTEKGAEGADQIVGPGYRRSFVNQLQPISGEELVRRIEAGKPTQLDPISGDMIVRTLRDQLPEGWILGKRAELEGQRVDSFGSPIVNDTPGLPAWAGRDVDALRAAVAQWRDELVRQRSLGADTLEVSGVLGNYIGQAITRGIPIDDLINIDEAGPVDGAVAARVLDYLHFYENIRSANQDLFGYRYAPTVYPARIADFAARHGRLLSSVQVIEPAGFTRRGLDCYSGQTMPVGMTQLSGQTDIWAATGTDDASADVPTGFPIFWFYPCLSGSSNDMVRVSTNGYLTFFQQGGGALQGAVFNNAPIPNTNDPSGFVAPWWDDLVVATNQGTADRVSYKTEGAVGQRVFTAEWFSMTRLFGDSSDFHYFQAKLYETTGVIDLQADTLWLRDSIDSATVGVEAPDGRVGECGPNCGPDNSSAPTNDFRFTPFRPFNDTCTGAEAVASGARVSPDLRSATADGAACGASTGNRDVWYSFTAPCEGTLGVNTCGSRGNGFGPDTVLSAYTGCPGTIANQLVCNDDAGLPGCAGVDSSIHVGMVTGQTLFIRLSHFGAEAFRLGDGQAQVAFDFSVTSPVSNDLCGGAAPLVAGQTIAGSLLCSSNDGANACGASQFNQDVWYTFIAPQDGQLNVDLCGSRNIAGPDTGIDGVLSIHSSCPGTFQNELTCNDDGHVSTCHRFDSFVSAQLVRGQQVFIRVSHFGQDQSDLGNGSYLLHSQFVSPCGSADFNCDGDVGTDADIEAFFRCIAGNCPAAPCAGSADFNGDGDVGTDGDIESFFRVLAGGSC